MLLLIPAAFYMADDGLRSNKAWVNALLGVSLLLISSPINLTMELFEQTGFVPFLSMHFIGGILLYLFLFVVWMDAHRISRQQISPGNSRRQFIQ